MIAKKMKAKRGASGRGSGRRWTDRDDEVKTIGGRKNQSSGQSSNAVPRKRRKPEATDLCFACGKRGHWADTCPDKGKPADE